MKCSFPGCLAEGTVPFGRLDPDNPNNTVPTAVVYACAEHAAEILRPEKVSFGSVVIDERMKPLTEEDK